MDLRRDARGTLRDYSRESEREPLPVFSSLFQCFKILNMTFPTTPLFKPYGDFPGLTTATCVFFHKAYSTHPTRAIASSKIFRIVAILFWRDKTKIISSVVKPISIDVVYKSPTVFRFSNNMVMNKIITKSGIAVVAFIKLYTDKFVFVKVFIDNRVPYEIMPHIIQRGFDYVAVNDCIRENSLFIYWHKSSLAPGFFPIIVEPTEPLGEMRTIAPWNVAYHTNIIPKNKKVSSRRNVDG